MRLRDFEDLDVLEREVLGDPDARAAAHENSLRRELGMVMDEHRRKKGLSFRKLAKTIGTSLSQVQRVLHHEVGGSLTLWTICRAAEALDLDISVQARTRRIDIEAPLHFRQLAWSRFRHERTGACRLDQPDDRTDFVDGVMHVDLKPLNVVSRSRSIKLVALEDWKRASETSTAEHVARVAGYGS